MIRRYQTADAIVERGSKLRLAGMLMLSLLFLATVALGAEEAGRTGDGRELRIERMLASILKSAPTGIGVVEHRVLVEVNDYILDLTGYTREELIGQNARMLYPTEEDSDYVGREKYRQISEKGTGCVETRWLRKDGGIRHVILSSTPLDPADLDAGVTFTVLDITDRKMAEKRLRESEERFSSLFHNHVSVKLLIDPSSGEIRDANPAAVAFYGWPRDKLVGMRIQEINTLAPEDVKQEMQRAKTRARTFFEFRHRRADGTIRDVAVFSSDVQMGPDILLYSIIHDITDQKQAEAALADRSRWFFLGLAALVLLLLGLVARLFFGLRQRKKAGAELHLERERMAGIIKGTNAGTWEWNVQTGKTVFNDRWAEIIGYSLAELAPVSIETWKKFAHPDDLKISQEQLEKHFAGRLDYYESESRMRHKSGQWVWVLDRGQVATWTEDGKPLMMFGTHQDITERKRAEFEAEESRLLLQTVLDTIPVRVFWKDLNLRYLGCNKPFATDAGRDSPSELIGKDDYQMGWLDQAELYRDDDREVIESKTPKLNFEEPQTTPDGKTIFLRTSKIPLRNAHGQIVGVLGTYEEITERKLAEQEREKLQSQLLQAQKMESVGILAGGVAHDFNNLLQTMRGNIELLAQSESLAPQGMTRLRTVTKAMDRAAELVQQLLLFSRKVESCKVPVDLNQVLLEATRMLERTVPKMVALDLHLDPAAWPVSGDPVQIEQILLNLANNAVDAMPEGGRLIIESKNVELDQDFVRSHPGSTAGGHVLLTVSDTGRGMDKTTLKHAFDPFFTTKEVGKGTGLGLASVYGIVTNHGGYIHCSSEPGQGTTFRIYLPAADACKPGPDLSHRIETTTKNKGLGNGNGNGGKTILVVDDEREIRELSQEALEDFGYTVLSAANGEEALAIYREQGQAIDLVLLDLNMPGIGGHKCLQELLQINPAVRVLIASGYSADSQARESLDSGAAGFICKPYQLKDLQAAVREALMMTEAERETGE